MSLKLQKVPFLGGVDFALTPSLRKMKIEKQVTVLQGLLSLPCDSWKMSPRP